MTNVTILLSTYNGRKYIRELLESLLKQQEVNVNIFVRDDGSTDGTQNILNEYKENGRLEWYQGENIKPARSFKELMKKAPATEYYAFCDQDDYWLPDKLIHAIEKLRENNDERACLYCGKPQIVDENLEQIASACSKRVIHAESFGARLIVRNAIGCTFVFNRKLLEMVNQIDPNFLEMHDIWTYEVCNMLGGYIFYDDLVPILYRQHGDNTVGANIFIAKRWKKRWKRFLNKERERSNTVKELYRFYGDMLEMEQKKQMKLLMDYQLSFTNKMRVILSKCYLTDSKKMNRNFKIAIFFGIF